jgi:hypothetical protein
MVADSSAAAWLIARYTEGLSFHAGGGGVGSANTGAVNDETNSASAEIRRVRVMMSSISGVVRRLQLVDE